MNLDPEGQSRVSDRLRRDLSSPNKLFRGLALNCLRLADAKQAVSLIGPLLGDSDIGIQQFARVTLMGAGVTFTDLWPHRAELPRRSSEFFPRFRNRSGITNTPERSLWAPE